MKLYQSTEICRSCQRDLRPVIDLGHVPLPRFRTKDALEWAPLELALCEDCGLLQLMDTVDPDKLFKEFWYEAGISTTMRNQLRDVGEAASIFLEPGDTICDIGCNDGTMFDYIPKGVRKVGYEPSQLAEKASRKADTIVQDYFKADYNGPYDVVTAIAMFYDLDDPNGFVEDVTASLKDDGVFIIQQNYLGDMLKNNGFDNIVHEHLEYYSLSSLITLLSSHGLHTFHVERNHVNGGSFRTYSSKDKRLEQPSIQRMLRAEAKMNLRSFVTYREFVWRAKNLKQETMFLLERRRERGERIHILGASTRGNTLLHYYGIDVDLVEAASERNPTKWGGEIVGTGIPIVSERESREMDPDAYLVLPWHFRKEITEREKESRADLIFPLPEISVVCK
jgi:SAM-dependent methyltransferase